MDGMRVFESLEAEYLRIEFENRFHLDRTITLNSLSQAIVSLRTWTLSDIAHNLLSFQQTNALYRDAIESFFFLISIFE